MINELKLGRYVLAAALLTSACAESPTAPSRQSAGVDSLRALKLGSYESTAFYVDGQLGKAWVKNATPSAAIFMFTLFDATNPNNQVDLESRNVAILQPGDSTRLTVGLKVPRCKIIVVQPDVWINPPKVGPNNKYTLGELELYGGGSTQTVSGEMDGCGTLPPTTPPSPPPINPPIVPPPPPPSVDPCTLYTVRSFDPFTARAVLIDIREAGVLGFVLTAGGTKYSSLDKVQRSTGVVTLSAPGGYYHETSSCEAGVVTIALVGNGQ